MSSVSRRHHRKHVKEKNELNFDSFPIPVQILHLAYVALIRHMKNADYKKILTQFSTAALM